MRSNSLYLFTHAVQRVGRATLVIATLTAALSCAEPAPEEVATDRPVGVKNSLDVERATYEIFSIEREVKFKGNPEYTLLRSNAVLTTFNSQSTRSQLEAVLRKAVEEVRRKAKGGDGVFEAVSVFLYQSEEHLLAGNPPLGLGEWWPKGHDLGPDNAANIQNRDSYVETIQIFQVPIETPSATEVPESLRRQIFAEIVKAQDRAHKEADELFPVAADQIPNEQLATYDWRNVLERNNEEYEKRRKIYKSELQSRYGVKQETLDDISREGLLEDWPLPPIQ